MPQAVDSLTDQVKINPQEPDLSDLKAGQRGRTPGLLGWLLIAIGGYFLLESLGWVVLMVVVVGVLAVVITWLAKRK